jgi:hypothetical protein
VIKPIPDNRQPTVQQTHGRHPHTVQLERKFRLDHVRHKRRHKRVVHVLVFAEDVHVHTPQKLERVQLRVDVNGLLHDGVEAPQFVDPPGVVDVVVREQHAVTARDRVSERLLAQVRPAVDENDAGLARGVRPSQRPGAAQAPVARVHRRAHIAGAADRGNARTRACAKKRKPHETKA